MEYRRVRLAERRHDPGGRSRAPGRIQPRFWPRDRAGAAVRLSPE